LSPFNADRAQALSSLDRLDGLEAGFVLPGHGQAWTGGLGEALRLARASEPPD
jgi:glyoxylase-like metal-dependent hydrolase (beta-lactamase superfamily II)